MAQGKRDSGVDCLDDEAHRVVLHRLDARMTIASPDKRAPKITVRVLRPPSPGPEAAWEVTLGSDVVEVTLGPLAARVEFELDGTLSYALFGSGVLHSSYPDPQREISSHLERFYAIRRGAGCASLDLRGAITTRTSIAHRQDDTVLVVVDFAPGYSTVRMALSTSASPNFAAGSARISDPQDQETHLVALWANQVGTLGGLDVPGSVYPTLKLPELEYGSLHTFFDPDSWSVLNCLSFSGDDYLIREARVVLDHVRQYVTPDGRVPHHFDEGKPKYIAISGATQPGPNIFYCLAVLDHVAATGDTTYLASLWSDTLVRCVEALVRTVDPARDLLFSEGPLWIDVFRREGYTLDTNAMFVHLLRRMSEAAGYLGDLTTMKSWIALADRISSAVAAFWRHDHYETVLPGTGDDLDMVDSDDVLTVLAGIADDATASIIFNRLEATGMHPGGRGTWVSRDVYGPDLCYDGNVGDSRCAFARIWWAEMRARRDRGDREGFQKMFDAVRGDLLRYTWMGERYDENGMMSRADGYHEYPGVLNILLREGSYGIVVDVASVDLRPMREGDLTYRVGELELGRTGHDWRVKVAGSGSRVFHFHDLVPGTGYNWEDVAVTVPANGSISLHGRAGVEQRLTHVHNPLPISMGR